MIAQAKEISKEAGRAYDSLALLEDVLGIRLSLARNDDDRAKWQTEYLTAREKMASSQIRSLRSGGSHSLSAAVTNRIPNPFATNRRPQVHNSEQPHRHRKLRQQPPSAQRPPNRQLISPGSLNGRETKRVNPGYPPTQKVTACQERCACLR